MNGSDASGLYSPLAQSRYENEREKALFDFLRGNHENLQEEASKRSYSIDCNDESVFELSADFQIRFNNLLKDFITRNTTLYYGSGGGSSSKNGTTESSGDDNSGEGVTVMIIFGEIEWENGESREVISTGTEADYEKLNEAVDAYYNEQIAKDVQNFTNMMNGLGIANNTIGNGFAWGGLKGLSKGCTYAGLILSFASAGYEYANTGTISTNTKIDIVASIGIAVVGAFCPGAGLVLGGCYLLYATYRDNHKK